MWRLRRNFLRGRIDFLDAIDLRDEDWSELKANIQSHYRLVRIPKRRSGHRELLIPDDQLMTAQRGLLKRLYAMLRPPRCLTGGVPKGSIRKHAEPHVAKKWVATFDIRDFFGSVGRDHVRFALMELELSIKVIEDILDLAFLDGTLPQGAPTSPLLANLALMDVDKRLRSMTRKRGLTLTRYLDDVAISGDYDFRELRGPIKQHFARAGFELAADKEKFMSDGTCQVVTGLVVNRKLRPTNEFYRRLKQDLNALSVIENVSRVRQAKGRLAHLHQFDPKAAESMESQTSALCTMRA